MDLLPAADQHRLRAADGWLDLGNPAESRLELDQISAQHRTHPDVLHLRWQIHRKSAEWEACFEVARTFTKLAPKDPRAWTSLAQTFYHSSRIQEAYDLALSKITTFPKYWPLYYDAACYACLTGRLPQASQFLQLATALGDATEVQRLASQDPDLAALRKSA
jgi:predicted Zn-dependent protease